MRTPRMGICCRVPILLPKKKIFTKKIFLALKNVSEQMNLVLNPKTIVTDFVQKGCFFISTRQFKDGLFAMALNYLIPLKQHLIYG